MNNFNYNPTASQPTAHEPEQSAFQQGGTHRETVPNPPPQQISGQHWPFSGNGVPFGMPPPQSHFRPQPHFRPQYGMASGPADLSPLSHQYSIGPGLNPSPQGYQPASPQSGVRPSSSSLSPLVSRACPDILERTRTRDE
jgi:hypothetical protein